MSFMSLNWAPASDIAVFAGALNLHNEFLHQPQLVPVFFPEMEQAGLRRVAERSVVAMKRVMIVERRDLSSRATLEVQKRIAIGHRPSNLVNSRQLQMTLMNSGVSLFG